MPGGGQRSRWRCMICKAKSGARAEPESQACKGDPNIKLASDASDLGKLAERCKRARLSKLDELGGADVGGDSDSGDGTEQRPHDPVRSGEIVSRSVVPTPRAKLSS